MLLYQQSTSSESQTKYQESLDFMTRLIPQPEVTSVSSSSSSSIPQPVGSFSGSPANLGAIFGCDHLSHMASTEGKEVSRDVLIQRDFKTRCLLCP